MSKFAPFVPRDFSDLEALQVLCGDHSERDVTVVSDDKTLARPWLTPWQDLRTGLIWGWHLSLVPSSQAAALAYADGVNNFGAQPLSRPDSGFYSYVYTDHGRTYKSHRWDGQVIAVHESVNVIEGGIGLLLRQRKIGILSDLQIRHLLARKWNAREKPLERFFRIVSEWEENTLDAYCGSNPSKRPDKWRTLYAQHQQYLSGNRSSSPFPTLEEYRDPLEEFINRYNHSEHQRWTLGGGQIIPIDEYRRLYLTRYEISRKALALLLLKPATRIIEKDGVNCFRRNWYYYHEAMSQFKGNRVEILFSDDDYRTVWVILPNNEICEANLISPTPLLNPNRSTLQAVKEAHAHERKLIRDYQLLNESNIRGETTEDRVTRKISHGGDVATQNVLPEMRPSSNSVHLLTRFDHAKITPVASAKEITVSEIAEYELDDSMFGSDEPCQVKELDDGEF